MTNNCKVQQRYSYPGCQVAEATTFCTVTPQLHGCSLWNCMLPFWRLEF